MILQGQGPGAGPGVRERAKGPAAGTCALHAYMQQARAYVDVDLCIPKKTFFYSFKRLTNAWHRGSRSRAAAMEKKEGRTWHSGTGRNRRRPVRDLVSASDELRAAAEAVAHIGDGAGGEELGRHGAVARIAARTAVRV